MEESYKNTIVTIQSQMKTEVDLREVFIPNRRAEAKCNIFVSKNYASCSKLVLFLQPGRGLKCYILCLESLFLMLRRCEAWSVE